MAIDPVRSEGIEFTGPYVVIEGAYAVPTANQPSQTNEDVDRDGVRIAVARGSAYDLYLTRAIKNAKLVREGAGTEAVGDVPPRQARGCGGREAADHCVCQGASRNSA